VAPKRAIPKVVEAQQFVLRDSKGRARAILSLEGKEQFPGFRLLDVKGKTGITIQLDNDGRALVSLESAAGVVGMSADNNGNIGISISRGDTGMPTFGLGINAGEEIRMTIYDKTGSPVWQAP
jgi:hypothetical protein